MSDANEPRPYLHGIECPSDLRKLPRDQVEQVASEIRQEILSRVSQTGGHLPRVSAQSSSSRRSTTSSTPRPTG